MAETRICERCGREHAQVNSPICGHCRHEGSKRPCPIPGCGRLIGPAARTCLYHRHLQQVTTYDACVECGAAQLGSHLPACKTCRGSIMVLCACGCGRYRRKYGAQGFAVEYISGHNDAKLRRTARTCAQCGRRFVPKHARQRLCGPTCRATWVGINRPSASKRMAVPCTVCGAITYRQQWMIRAGRNATCSPRCHYIRVRNALKGRISRPKKLALQRDALRCRVCGFDVLVEVHHIIPRREGGPDELGNLITLCPNHHTMADRRLLSADELRAYLPSGAAEPHADSA